MRPGPGWNIPPGPTMRQDVPPGAGTGFAAGRLTWTPPDERRSTRTGAAAGHTAWTHPKTRPAARPWRLGPGPRPGAGHAHGTRPKTGACRRDPRTEARVCHPRRRRGKGMPRGPSTVRPGPESWCAAGTRAGARCALPVGAEARDASGTRAQCARARSWCAPPWDPDRGEVCHPRSARRAGYARLRGPGRRQCAGTWS